MDQNRKKCELETKIEIKLQTLSTKEESASRKYGKRITWK